MFFKNKKIHPILSTSFVLLLAVIASGFIWMDTHEGSRTRAEGGITSISACDTGLSGYAWTENVGWISMNGASYSVKIDPNTGILSGYAWSENIGWVKFNPTVPNPAPDGTTLDDYSAKYDSSRGKIYGWASIIINQSDPTPSGWIKMSDDAQNYGVSINPSTGALSGYAWSEDYGWIDFGEVTYGCVVEINSLEYTDGILVYTSAQGENTNNDASVTSGNNIIYSLELTNQGNLARTVNLKFDMPYGYIFNPTTADVNCTVGITPCGNPNTPIGTVNGNGTNPLLWNNVSVPVGESKISFTLTAP